MLTLAVVLVALPTLFAQLGHTSTSDERVVSYGAAILMLIVYAAYLYHSLRAAGTRTRRRGTLAGRSGRR